VRPFGHSRVLRVDEVGILGVVLDEGAHDRAHDGDRLSLRAHVIEDASDQLGGDALFAELRDTEVASSTSRSSLATS
jgi:hypothetical protein